jgi:hypothetical protein
VDDLVLHPGAAIRAYEGHQLGRILDLLLNPMERFELCAEAGELFQNIPRRGRRVPEVRRGLAAFQIGDRGGNVTNVKDALR